MKATYPADDAFPEGSPYRIGERVQFHVYPGSRVGIEAIGGFRGEVIGGWQGNLLVVQADDGRICRAGPDYVVPDGVHYCDPAAPVVCTCCRHPSVQPSLFDLLVGAR